MWQRFRSWPWWAQGIAWICLPPAVLSVWLWQRSGRTWLKVALAVAAFALWTPIVFAAVGGGSESQPATQSNTDAQPTTESTTTAPSQPAEAEEDTVDYDAVAREVLAAQRKVLSASKKLKSWRGLPREVRRAYDRLDQLLGRNAAITEDEYYAVTANLVVLKSAISSGELNALIAEAKAEARAKARARARKKAREKAQAVAAAAEAAAAQDAASNCNENYSGCLRANASDYDCEGGSGDGPYYTGTVQVIGNDEYDLDSDSDGIGCDP
jgi:hypothetical protein